MAAPKSAITQRIESAERRCQYLRPATLRYADTDYPCTPGNHDFFERLASDGGGFQALNGLFVKIVRSDLPAGLVFKRGENVRVTDNESGDVYDLTVGVNNSRQAALFILNLESVPA